MQGTGGPLDTNHSHHVIVMVQMKVPFGMHWNIGHALQYM